MVARSTYLAALALPLAARAASGSSAKESTITAAPATATAAASSVVESTSPLALTDYHYSYEDIPYQVNPFAVGRGPQSGYNICNSTTQGEDSECQTLIVNDIDDFCVWGSPYADGQIGDVEAAVVAYCTPKNGHGGRVIPDGTITGVQFITTSAYIQITGFLNQSGVGLMANDTGGELDPHGADDLGNPLGGLVYSTNIPTGDNKTLIQVDNWNLFIGAGTFCLKACYNNVTSPDYCENKLDLVGCDYNMPSNNTVGEFVKCDGDLQDVVGVYTAANGTVMTWAQPSGDDLPADYTMPYTPRVPASSNCVTYASTELFGGSTSSAAASTSTSASKAGAKATSASAKATSSAAVPTATKAANSTSGARKGEVVGGARFTLAVGAAALIAGLALVV